MLESVITAIAASSDVALPKVEMSGDMESIRALVTVALILDNKLCILQGH